MNIAESAVIAHLQDQWGAVIRDAFDEGGINLRDPESHRVLGAVLDVFFDVQQGSLGQPIERRYESVLIAQAALHALYEDTK